MIKTKRPKLSGFAYRLAKQKKELQEDGKKCLKLTDMFIKCGKLILSIYSINKMCFNFT